MNTQMTVHVHKIFSALWNSHDHPAVYCCTSSCPFNG